MRRTVCRSERSVIAVFFAVLALIVTYGQEAPAQEIPATMATGNSEKVLSAPHQRVIFDSTPFSAGSVVPHWEKGYLVSTNTEITGPSVWAVRLYDARGTKVREVNVWFPGSLRVFADSAAVTPEGRVVISGVAEKTDGTRAYYLASTDAVGQVTNVIQTNPYLALQICVAPDGTIWSFGGSSNELKEDLTFRHFDMRKGELAAYLPRSSFNSRFNPSVSRGEGAHVALTCGAERVVIYTEIANEYIELDYATQNIRRWQIDHSGYDLPLMGNRLAITSSGDVYAVLGRRPMNPGLRGLFHLQRDPAAAKVYWLPIEGQTGGAWDLGMINDVLGADEDSLVYFTRNDWPAVKWARPRHK